MHRRAALAFLIMFAVIFSYSFAEEVTRYEIGLKMVKGQVMKYDLSETAKTLITNPDTKETAVISITTTKYAQRVVLEQNGIWMKTLEGSAFRDLKVDEATSQGVPLPAEEINKEKIKELKKHRIETDIFVFSTISEFGQPDPAKNKSDKLEDILNFASGNIAFLPPAKREIGESWERRLKIGSYVICIEYELTNVEKKNGVNIGKVVGSVSFGKLAKSDKLRIIRELSFVLHFNVENNTLVHSELKFVAGIIKSGSIINRTLKVVREQTSLIQLSDAQLARAVYETERIKYLTELVKAKKYDESYDAASAILKAPDCLFTTQMKVYLRDRIFMNWNIEGRVVKDFWFSEWINSPALQPAKLKGKVIVIAFFDPSISSSTRIWRPFDDWKEHFGPKGLEVIAASAAKPDSVKKYIKEMNVTHNIAIDEDYLMLNYFQVDVVPTFFVLDKAGKIVLRVIGKKEIYKVHKKLEEFFGKIED